MLDYVDNEEVRRRVAFTARMIKPKQAPGQAYSFEKVFTESEFMAGGIIEIPVGAEKPLKPSRDNSYVRRPPPVASLTYADVLLRRWCALSPASTHAQALSAFESTARSSRSRQVACS